MPPQNILRTLVRAQPRSLAGYNCQRRSFVSTVLLSKTYEDKTVAELRSEARKRGLAVSGSKATLITRIQTDDTRSVHATPVPSAPAPPSRNASTSAGPAAVAAVQSRPPPILDIHIPDLNRPVPETPVQIPFVPDFWESSKEKATNAQEETPSTPKLILTAGASTHHGGGPSFNAYDFTAESTESSRGRSDGSDASGSSSGSGGVISDVLDDLGLAGLRLSPKRDAKLEAEMKELLTYEATVPKNREYSRKLDDGEKKGLYVLLGIFGGGWLLGGVLGH